MKEYTDEQQYALIERLIPFYKKYIENAIDWERVEKDCEDEDGQRTEDGDTTGSSFLGSVFSIMPSGKYWTFWACSNVDQKEMMKDTAFNEALELVANEHGYWIEAGEGDPCDLFICKLMEEQEDEND